jgi:hypothetical protein
MRFPNVFKAKHSGRFCFIAASGHLIGDGLERNIRQRKAWVAEPKTDKEAEMDTARHLQQRVEVAHRSKPSEKARQTGAPTRPKHREGIQNRAVANEIAYGVDPFPFSNALRQVVAFYFDAACSECLQLLKAFLVTGCCNDIVPAIIALSELSVQTMTLPLV